MSTNTFERKYGDWDYLTAAAKAVTDLRDWLKESGMTCSGIPGIRFGIHGGKPHLLCEMIVAVPIQIPTGGTPTNAEPKAPSSSASASANRSRKSRNRETTVSLEGSELGLPEQNAAVS